MRSQRSGWYNIGISRRPLRGTPSPHSPCTFIFSVSVYVSRCLGDAIHMQLAQLSRRRRAICGRSSAKLAYLTFVAEVSGWRQTDFDGCRGFGQALARVTYHDIGRRPFRETTTKCPVFGSASSGFFVDRVSCTSPALLDLGTASTLS